MGCPDTPWIGLLPGPAITAHLRQGSTGAPVQHGLGGRRAGFQAGHIAGSTLHNLIRNGYPRGLLESVHHIQHAESAPGTDVQGQRLRRLSLVQMVKSLAMGFGQIHDMQVITDAGAIRVG